MKSELRPTDAPEAPAPQRARRRGRAGRDTAVDTRPILRGDVGFVELYLAQLRRRAGWSSSRSAGSR